MDTDLQVRLAAFVWLAKQVELQGDDVLPRTLLVQGFEFQGKRIPLMAPNGIFKPKVMDLPISITTVPEGPYNDSLIGKFVTYRYRGENPNHSDNEGLRKVFKLQRPLVYFYGILSGQYMAVWPVYIIDDSPSRLTFTVAIDNLASLDLATEPAHQVVEARREYVTAEIKVRLHQRSFRERVIDAYHSQCAFCRLKHRELLDGAHIIPDNEPEGKPTVDNGLSLCKLHHAAYDKLIIGVTPDYIIQVREDILEENDGPGLQHGLKDLHRARLILPASKSQWPNRDSLAWRFDKFTRAR